MSGYCKEGENHCVCGGDTEGVRATCGNWVKIDPTGPMPVIICGHGGHACNYPCHGKARGHCKPVPGATTITFKDHELREFVNALTEKAKKFNSTMMLREQMAGVVNDFIKGKFK